MFENERAANSLAMRLATLTAAVTNQRLAEFVALCDAQLPPSLAVRPIRSRAEPWRWLENVVFAAASPRAC